MAANIEIAQAQIHIASAAKVPAIDASLNISKKRTSAATSTTAFNPTLGMSWEADLWGQINTNSLAVQLDHDVSVANWRATQLSLAAKVAKSWYQLTHNRLQVELVEQRIQNLSNTLAIIEENFKLGLNPALDVYLARANLASETAKRTNLQQQLDAAKRSLEVLLGRFPKAEINNTLQLQTITADIPAGLPSDLLMRRPDLVAHYKQLLAADKRAAVAHYNRFPRLSLTGSTGFSANTLTHLFSSDYWLWSALSSLAAPVFDRGKHKAEYEISKANAKAAEAKYSQSVLNAFREVETSLQAEKYLVKQTAALSDAVKESAAAEKLAFEQYQNGLVDIITLLESQRRSFDAQSSIINVRNQHLQNRIDLYLALGGSFVDNQIKTSTKKSTAEHP